MKRGAIGLIVLFTTISVFTNLYFYIKANLCTRLVYSPLHPNTNISAYNLLEEGFKLVPVDVPMVSRKVDNINYIYELTFYPSNRINQVVSNTFNVNKSVWDIAPISLIEDNKVKAFRCEIETNAIDKVSLEKLFERYYGEIVSDVINPNSGNESQKEFYVISRKTYGVFRFTIEETPLADHKYLLSTTIRFE